MHPEQIRNLMWRVYIITDTGREVPHMGFYTRRRAREYLRAFKRTGLSVRAFIRKEGK